MSALHSTSYSQLVLGFQHPINRAGSTLETPVAKSQLKSWFTRLHQNISLFSAADDLTPDLGVSYMLGTATLNDLS